MTRPAKKTAKKRTRKAGKAKAAKKRKPTKRARKPAAKKRKAAPKRKKMSKTAREAKKHGAPGSAARKKWNAFKAGKKALAKKIWG